MTRGRTFGAYAGAALIGAVLCAFSIYKYRNDLDGERRAYVARRTQEAERVAERVEGSFRAFYQGLRTMAALPGVRTIDRDGANFHPDSRASMQQVYNNTYLNVQLSEVYLLPATLDPDRVDPRTGRPEEPILTFDEFITGDARSASAEGDAHEAEELEEVEVHEYRLMREQLRALAARHPTNARFAALDVPALLGPPVVTCDNTEFSRAELAAHDDRDRMGLVYTVPVYGTDRRFRGAVSGVVRLNVLERLLPPGDYAIASTTHGYVGAQSPSEALRGAMAYHRAGRGDPRRVFSLARTLRVIDGAPWQIWVTASDAQFWAEPGVRQARLLCHAGVGVALLLTLLFGVALTFLLRNERTLARRVEAATAELAGRNADMRRILDHAEEGFCTVALDGTVVGEFSASVARWFGDPRGKKLGELLFAPSQARERALMALGWEQVAEDLLPLEVTQAQLPRSISRGGQQFELSLCAIREGGGALRAVLAVISDVTAQRRVAAQDVEQRELVAAVQASLRDREGFVEFIKDASTLVDRLARPAEGVAPEEEFQTVHTLKGNCAQMGVATLGARLHALEGELVEQRRGLDAAERAGLAEAWGAFRARVEGVVTTQEADTLTLDPREVDGVMRLVRAQAPVEEIIGVMRGWSMTPLRARVERLARWAAALAQRVGVDPLRVEVDADEIRLPRGAHEDIWPTLTHLIRNAVDHGIRSAQPANDWTPCITVGARTVDEGIEIHVADNGSGVDWEVVRAKAARRGLPSETQEQLVEALFADGLSTRDEASELSGRGVGMSAVKRVARESGGRVSVHSTRGEGTRITLVLPHPPIAV